MSGLIGINGWEDEENHGMYCFCDDCELIRDNQGDQEYEAYRYERDNE